MILALDTDVLVHWAMQGAPRHRAVRSFIRRAVSKDGLQLGLAPQILHDFLHVCTDARRFEHPLEMKQAIALARSLWDGKETARILPGPTVVHRVLELLATLRLGRKRILDTALAATLESAGVRRLATLNAADFRVFSFLEIVDPAVGTRQARG